MGLRNYMGDMGRETEGSNEEGEGDGWRDEREGNLLDGWVRGWKAADGNCAAGTSTAMPSSNVSAPFFFEL